MTERLKLNGFVVICFGGGPGTLIGWVFLANQACLAVSLSFSSLGFPTNSAMFEFKQSCRADKGLVANKDGREVRRVCLDEGIWRGPGFDFL